MLNQIPASMKKVDKEDLDKEIIRTSIIAELNAINLYEQLSALTTNEDIKKALLEVARERKSQVEKFQTMLLEYDQEQREIKLAKNIKMSGKLLWNMY